MRTSPPTFVSRWPGIAANFLPSFIFYAASNVVIAANAGCRLDAHPQASGKQIPHRFRQGAVGGAARNRLGVRKDGGGPSLLGAGRCALVRRGQFRQGSEKFLPKNPGAGAPAHGRLRPASAQAHALRSRHGPAHGAEIVALGTRSIAAIADFLGSKPFFMGGEPTGADATMFAFVAGALCPYFDTPLRTAAERHENLRRYVGRMTARYYPELGQIAGCPAAA